MSKKLVIQHDLSKLSAEALEQYKRDVSTFIGLDPDLNALDTIWMPNEQGPGQSLVLYARRGTAEILRDINGIEVTSLTHQVVNGSIVFTAVGKNKQGRQEIATGSKDISKLSGKHLDDSIMTASTRALRRLTMQFTKLGLLDQSEVESVVGSTANPASEAKLAGSPMVIPPQPVVVNNAPGKDITTTPALLAPPVVVNNALGRDVTLEKIIEEVKKFPDIEPALVIPAKKADTDAAASPVTHAESPVSQDIASDKEADKPKRARRKPNTVNLEGPEPEIVNNSPSPAPEPPPAVAVAPTPEVAATPAPVAAPAPPAADPDPNKPTQEQMSNYRKRIGVYTAELPSSENMGSVQKMRAFITKMSGNTPQEMSVDQWEEMLTFFESFVAKNGIKGLVKYVNDSLGV